MLSSDDVLFEYISQGNPKSNDDFGRFLRHYPQYREELIDFTATWRPVPVCCGCSSGVCASSGVCGAWSSTRSW